MPDHSIEVVQNVVNHIQSLTNKIGEMTRRDIGYYSVEDILKVVEELCRCIQESAPEIKGWCKEFFRDNQHALWLVRGLNLGLNGMSKYKRYNYSNEHRIKSFHDEFTENYRDIFFNPNMKTWNGYDIYFPNSHEFIEKTKHEIANSPEVLEVHANHECVYYHMFDDCDLCETRDRLKEDMLEEARKQSKNIFVNDSLMFPFFNDLISNPDMIQSLKYLWGQWIPIPILHTDYYSDLVLTSLVDTIKLIKEESERYFKPGVTPIVIVREWASYIVGYYMYYRSMYTHENIRHDGIKPLTLFMKCSSRVELLEHMVPIILETVKRIREIV
jgi:hypothetical protein